MSRMTDEQQDELWHEVKGMMEDAEEDPESVQPLSSDEEGYVDRLMDGRTAPVSRRPTAAASSSSASARKSSVPATGDSAFTQRMLAAFDGLSSLPTPPGVSTIAEGRIGPAFEQQCRGHALAEPVAAAAADDDEPGGHDEGDDDDEGEDDDDDRAYRNYEEEHEGEEQDPSEWSRHTASWAADVSDSEAEDEEVGDAAPMAAKRTDASGAGASSSAVGLASSCFPSASSSSTAAPAPASSSSACASTPAGAATSSIGGSVGGIATFGGLSDLRDLDDKIDDAMEAQAEVAAEDEEEEEAVMDDGDGRAVPANGVAGRSQLAPRSPRKRPIEASPESSAQTKRVTFQAPGSVVGAAAAAAATAKLVGLASGDAKLAATMRRVPKGGSPLQRFDSADYFMDQKRPHAAQPPQPAQPPWRGQPPLHKHKGSQLVAAAHTEDVMAVEGEAVGAVTASADGPREPAASAPPAPPPAIERPAAPATDGDPRRGYTCYSLDGTNHSESSNAAALNDLLRVLGASGGGATAADSGGDSGNGTAAGDAAGARRRSKSPWRRGL